MISRGMRGIGFFHHFDPLLPRLGSTRRFGFQCGDERILQADQIKRFEEGMADAAAVEAGNDAARVVAGNGDDRHERMGRLHATRQFPAVDTGHVDIGKQEIEVAVFRQALKGFLAVFGRDRLVAQAFQHTAYHLARGRLIIDDQHM